MVEEEEEEMLTGQHKDLSPAAGSAEVYFSCMCTVPCFVHVLPTV